MALMIGCIWHGLDALQGTRAKPGNHLVFYKFKCYPKEAATMKNTLRSRPRTVANRPTSGGWGNKKCFFRPAAAGQGLIGGADMA